MALELVPRYAKVSQDGAYRPWTESAMSMVGYRCSSMRGFIDPDLMTALTVPIKPTSQGEQFPCQFSIGHTTTRWLVEPIGVGTTVGGSGSPCSRYDSMNALATSARVLSVSSGVLPHALQPGRAAASAMYISGSVD